MMIDNLTIAVIVFILANLIDFLTTVRGLRGGARERNPIAVKWLRKYGVKGLLWFKIIYMSPFIVVAYIIGNGFGEWIMWIGVLLLAIPYVNNVIVILRILWRKITKWEND